MEIRSLDKDDIASLLTLYGHLNPEDSAIGVDELNDIWAQTSESGVIQYIGVFAENNLLSVCQMVVIPNLTRGGLPYCLVENVVTCPEHQNKGHGKALLKHVIDLAWSKGCYKVMLMSGRKEHKVLQFYKSAGFSADEKTAFIVRASCT